MVDLDTWNLTIPAGTPATTISSPRLQQGYSDSYFKAANGTVLFWAPVTGSHSSRAKFPRSELRETYPNGSERNWYYPAADNQLRAALSINQVPSSGRIAIGQIHINDSKKPLLILEYQYKDNVGSIVAKIRKMPDDKRSFKAVIMENVPLNQRFTYSIHLTPSGTLSVTSLGGQWVGRLDSVWKTKPMYFKAGVYTLDNTGYSSEGGKATFYRLGASHRPPKPEVSALK